MEWLVIIVYSAALMVISIFSIGQLNLALHSLKKGKEEDSTLPELTTLPSVTIQLPVYNERFVVERLLRAVAKIDYPVEQIEIQVLDDSTDDTSEIIAKTISEIDSQKKLFSHIRRDDRTGFKAGALQFGLDKSNGDFIAIFDADFLPKPDFLKSTLPHFGNENIGMVQTKWAHLNADYSVLTRMQAFGLNAHFSIEQNGRYHAGSFINFNGTGGIWRRDCILDAGGWEFDTLTEDLDLSYRAQLKGWNFKYIENIQSPAELPILVPAIKSQQYRWTKGAAETARKNLGKVLASTIEFKHKVRAVLHLLNSTVFLLLLIASVLSIPMLFIKGANPTLKILFDLGSIFIVGFIAIAIFYWFAAKANYPKNTKRYYWVNFPLYMIFSMGLALHNSVALVEGFLGIKTPFVRTPKFNVISKTDKWVKSTYLNLKWSWSGLVEGILALYFLFGIFAGFYLMDYGLLAFHLMLTLGFGSISYLSTFPQKHA